MLYFYNLNAQISIYSFFFLCEIFQIQLNNLYLAQSKDTQHQCLRTYPQELLS